LPTARAREIVIREGQTTQLRVEIPEGYEDLMQELTKDANWYLSSRGMPGQPPRDARLDPLSLELTEISPE
jgi:hypothetical protein